MSAAVFSWTCEDVRQWCHQSAAARSRATDASGAFAPKPHSIRRAGGPPTRTRRANGGWVSRPLWLESPTHPTLARGVRFGTGVTDGTGASLACPFVRTPFLEPWCFRCFSCRLVCRAATDGRARPRSREPGGDYRFLAPTVESRIERGRASWGDCPARKESP
jgi:hypothetical protein